ncbi:NUDIX domain-containing protein [Candidatus Nomurabacteria bacterium]|nr:NUDIX domain-containing protein [Candidatus Kaiserbacteria bacterium]MCB9811079.1 NUDIX domain-containing protein [Candidatus Nomurabacteria bacterium]MCB9814939.1 NUDIX domain-containing protein [Candidatus Nomurabacteria bacterium]
MFGGLVDEGESAEECVLREVYEELGIALEKVELVLVRIRDESGQSVEDNIFASKVTVDETKLELTEGADMKWFSVAELQEADIVPHFKNVIINYCNTL